MNTNDLASLAYALNAGKGRWLSIQVNGERHIIFVDAVTNERIAIIKFVPGSEEAPILDVIEM